MASLDMLDIPQTLTARQRKPRSTSAALFGIRLSQVDRQPLANRSLQIYSLVYDESYGVSHHDPVLSSRIDNRVLHCTLTDANLVRSTTGTQDTTG